MDTLNLGRFSKQTEQRAKTRIAIAAKEGRIDPNAVDVTVGVARPATAIQSFLTKPDSPDYDGGTTKPGSGSGSDYGNRPAGVPVDSTDAKKDHLDRRSFRRAAAPVSDIETVIPGPADNDASHVGGPDTMPNPATTRTKMKARYEIDPETGFYKPAANSAAIMAKADEYGDDPDDDADEDQHVGSAQLHLSQHEEATDDEERMAHLCRAANCIVRAMRCHSK